jgi:hypothetical protein
MAAGGGIHQSDSTDERQSNGGGKWVAEDGDGPEVRSGDGNGSAAGRRGGRIGPPPAGFRTGLSEEAAAERAYRPTPDQEVTSRPTPLGKFTHTQFIGYLDGDIKMKRSGDLALTISIPFEYATLAFPLHKAFGLPLSVDIQLWSPYANREGGVARDVGL